MTVYNRKETTLACLRNLKSQEIPKGYSIDIFMTNDGCTDGTPEAVAEDFPEVHIIQGDGNLYWSKGMNLAWKAANNHCKYDYFVWINDDAVLYPNAFKALMTPLETLGEQTIVSGAFMDSKGNVSYGGSNKKYKLLSVDGTNRDITYMNGNFVLIPYVVFQKIGFIDMHYTHGLGDWDYGLTAKENGIRVFLTSQYVGVTDRHNNDDRAYLKSEYPLMKRFELLYSKRYSVTANFHFNYKHKGICSAVGHFLAAHVFTIFPSIYKIRNK